MQGGIHHARPCLMDKLVCRSAALPPHDPRLGGPGFTFPANAPSLSDKADANDGQALPFNIVRQVYPGWTDEGDGSVSMERAGRSAPSGP